MGGSISFEQAAGYYDQTRGAPPELEAATTALLAAELRQRGLCLEIGVGTGRIALPLARVGIPMVGVDISRAMLGRLLAKAGSDAFPVVIADATALPFPDRLFGSALAAHVFHLIPNWQGAVAELWRVVQPGGVIVVSLGGAQGWEQEVSDRFYSEAGAPPHPGQLVDVEAEMTARGARLRLLGPIRGRVQGTIEERIARHEARYFSRSWTLEPETCLIAAEATRTWARQRFGDITLPRPIEVEISWQAFDLPV